ncbi:MAG: PAS domain S-box protein, partial [Chloroflexota bacterium]
QRAIILEAISLERERTLAELKHSKEKLNNILESIDDAFFAVDRNLRFTYVNRQGGLIAGRDPEELIGKKVYDLWPQLAGSPVESLYMEAIKQGTPIHCRFPGIFTSRHFEAGIYPSEEGVSAFVIDKTESFLQEKALRASEERLVDFLESTHDSFFALDRDWQIVYANRRFGDLVKRDPQALTGKNFWEEFPRYQGTLIEQHCRGVMDKRTPVQFQASGIYTQNWYEVAVYPTREGISVFCTDRTEEKMAVEKLRQSEALYRAIARNIPDGGVVVVDRDLVGIVAEGAMFNEIGMRRETVEGHHVSEISDDRLRVPLDHLFKQALSGETTSYEMEFKGRTIWTKFAPLLDDRDNPIAALALSLDITERKEAEEALRESEERFRTSVESILDGFAILSAIRSPQGEIVDFRYEYINEAGCRMNRRSKDEQIGRTLLELLPAHKGSAIFERYIQVMETGQPLTVEDLEYEDVYGGGQRLRRVFDTTAVKMCDSMVLTWRDVTQRKEANERFLQLNQTLAEYTHKLERSNKELQEFAYVASHDLQEPLRKVSAFGSSLYKLLQGKMTDNERDQFIRLLKANGRMQDMIKDLLELSRVTTQGRPFQPVDLRRVAEDVVS